MNIELEKKNSQTEQLLNHDETEKEIKNEGGSFEKIKEENI